MIFHSIRWRLQIWYGVILVAVLTGFGVTAYQLERGRQIRNLDSELGRKLGVLSSALAESRPRPGPGLDGPPLDGPPPRRGDLIQPDGEFDPPDRTRPPRSFRLSPMMSASLDEGMANGFYYSIWRRDGSQLWQSTNCPISMKLPVGQGPGQHPAQFREEFREILMVTPPGEIMLAGKSIARERADLRRLGWSLSGVGAAVLLFGLAGGWWLASKVIQPIKDISATATRISAGDLSQRIGTNETESELSRLASILNSTFARLEAAFARQRQFTSDASHELRTPVSVILTQIQTTLKSDRSAADYKETLVACQRAAQRMKNLIESLLALARMDAGQETFDTTPFDLGKTTGECVELVRPLAEARRISIGLELIPLQCVGDSHRLAQVITNLLTNAINYNREGGNIRVSAQALNGHALVSVADDGPGISNEHLPRIFDRFYRVDGARTAAQGRTGLGLAISREIVEAHAGTIEAESEPGNGATFKIRLPLAK
jgi:heavy metal sensor kinase